jgi:hypothetical protein
LWLLRQLGRGLELGLRLLRVADPDRYRLAFHDRLSRLKVPVPMPMPTVMVMVIAMAMATAMVRLLPKETRVLRRRAREMTRVVVIGGRIDLPPDRLAGRLLDRLDSRMAVTMTAAQTIHMVGLKQSNHCSNL